MTSVTVLVVPEEMVDQPERRLIMPRALGDKAQAQAQATFNAMVLIWLIICLVILALLLFDQSFSKAAVELMTRF